ncbi:FtsW/RodA/SpoVE family cell cycle protein [Luteolibacter marinus]|uniref:FtsW/RodA/SpoVE family cell cycle protein n=1 Tax=Luteolibacter marinus TaxID=2776705 RepID=UPI001868CEB4|nr:FtsW/RodA/SpoVE family cell cycle protein [Luteolibacter marinus]
MTPLFRKLLGLNWPLVLTMYGLLVFGVFSIESAARHLPQGGAWFADKQKDWILIGSVVYFGAALIDYKWVKWLAIPLFGVAMALCVSLIGKDRGDVHQIDSGLLRFQPAPMAIVAGIILLSWLLQDLPRLGRRIPKVGWIFEEPIVKVALVGLFTGVPFLIVVAMGDMGSALVWVPLAVICLLVSGVPFRYLSCMGLLAAAIIPIAYFVVLPTVSETGTKRIELFLDMVDGKEVDVSGPAWAPHNIAIAVGKSGWAGVGWNASANDGSLHDKKFVPWKTAHNDFIFPIIAEEHGFRGSILLITAFGLLLVLCLFIGTYARDPMGRLLVGGVVALFFAHIFESIGMCILLMPITGIPLPLVSYSGTFVVMCMFLLGLVQSVWVHRDAERPLVEEAPDKAVSVPSRR